MENTNKKSFFSDLWARRVPQFIATYVGICWGILQFLIFATGRYDLNNAYIDKFLIFSLVFIPAVFVFIYNHGRPGKDTWKQYEKVLIPLNFVGAMLFAGLFGGGGEVQAASTEVTVTTDIGETITRMIPANEQTKSFALFPFLNKTGSKENAWLKYAVPKLMKKDMEQDMRLFCLDPFGFNYHLESNNQTVKSDDIPFATHLKIARDRIVDYFAIGEITEENDELNYSVKIYETKTSDVFYEKTFKGQNIFNLVDEINSELSDQLFLEKSNLKISVSDLPASNLISQNMEALKAFFELEEIRQDNKDQTFFLERIRRISNMDPNSALFKSELATAYYMNANQDSAVICVNEVLGLSETLPEREKFLYRQYYYSYTDQRDKLIPLMESWRKLYPRDYYPFQSLLSFYTMTNDTKNAKQVAINALDNGHGARVLKNLAGLCIGRKEFEEAEKYLEEYYELFPDKNKQEDLQLADIYLNKGEFQKAEKWYEAIALLNPNDFNPMIKLGNVYVYQGAFDKSEETYLKALKQCHLLQDSLTVYISLIQFYTKTGQVEKFAEVVKKHFDGSVSQNNYVAACFGHLPLSSLYTYMGQENAILEMNDTIQKYAPQLFETFLCASEFLISLSLEDRDRFAKANTPECQKILTNATPNLIYMIKGIEHKFADNHKEAIKMFETYLDSTESNRDMFGGWIAEQYRLDGNNKKAIEYCLESLKLNPTEGTFILELAEAYLADGQMKKAKLTYDKLKTEIWNKAEPKFYFYKRMVELEKKLGAS